MQRHVWKFSVFSSVGSSVSLLQSLLHATLHGFHITTTRNNSNFNTDGSAKQRLETVRAAFSISQ